MNARCGRPSTGRRPRKDGEETDVIDARRIIGMKAKRVSTAKRGANRRERRAARQRGCTD